MHLRSKFKQVSTFDRRSLLCAAGAVLAGLVPASSEGQISEPQGSKVGTVEDASGEVFAETKKARRKIERASPIFVNDRVGTGPNSRLWLSLGADISVRLGANVRLLIDKFVINTGGEMTLESGAMLFEKRGPDRSNETKIQSPYGLIEVRGTRFFAGLSNKVFGVFVEEGAVAVSAGGRQVIVRTGEGSDIARPGSRPTEPKAWGQARIQSALASVR